MRFKFIILNEITLGVKIYNHLYKVMIEKRHDGELYWILKFNGRLIYITPLKSEAFYDILLKITEHEKEL